MVHNCVSNVELKEVYVNYIHEKKVESIICSGMCFLPMESPEGDHCRPLRGDFSLQGDFVPMIYE